MSETRVGISGWLYPRWRGTFYPKGLPHASELPFAASRLNSVELNGSFHSLQRPQCYAQWRAVTPDGFVFSIKGSRFITHMKKLNDVGGALANFLASGVLALEGKLGPILWQLPPNLGFDADRLRRFFDLLPRDTVAAAKLGKKHDERVKGRSYLRVDEKRPIRHALEVRHETFMTPAFIDVLREHQIALCVADTAGKFPFLEDVTADFVYVRLHGDVELYASGYSDDALDRWAHKVRTWQSGKDPREAVRISPKKPPKRATRDVFVYFDNDAKVHAPFDATISPSASASSGAARSRSSASPAPPPSATNGLKTRETTEARRHGDTRRSGSAAAGFAPRSPSLRKTGTPGRRHEPRNGDVTTGRRLEPPRLRASVFNWLAQTDRRSRTARRRGACRACRASP